MTIEIGPNLFKRALAEGKPQIGFWSNLSSALVIDLLSDCGYDWLLLDSEHSPVEVPDTFNMLLAADRSSVTTPVVRPSWNDPVMFKKLLDIGARSILVPMVQTAEEAARAVAATRYPLDGMRGVAGSIRASRYGRITDYHTKAVDDICVLLQIESQQGLDNLEAIAETDGVDGVFIGPADLGAALGYVANRNDPAVIDAIKQANKRIRAIGKPTGILTADPVQGQMWLDEGFSFVAVGIDTVILAKGADALAKQFGK
jgi:4-hydroxy-2-oxoheptanedioate aldolase